MRRTVPVVVIGLLVASLAAFPVRASDDETQATVEALLTQVAHIQATLEALQDQGAPTVTASTSRGSATPSPAATIRPTIDPTGDGSSPSTPLPLGQTGRVGDYLITVIRVNDDAEAEILATNQFNDPARPGYRMVMATLELTYDGQETGDPFWDLVYKVLGSRGLAYADTDEESQCGSEPQGLIDAPEMFPGGTVTGNVCWQMPEDEVDSLVMFLEPLFSFEDDDRVFFALQP